MSSLRKERQSSAFSWIEVSLLPADQDLHFRGFVTCPKSFGERRALRVAAMT